MAQLDRRPRVVPGGRADVVMDAAAELPAGQSQRVNVYLPMTLARRVEEARRAGRPVNLSAAAQQGIAAALNGCQPSANGHQAAAAGLAVQLRDQADDGGRLDAIEDKFGQLTTALGIVLALMAAGIAFVSVRVLVTS